MQKLWLITTCVLLLVSCKPRQESPLIPNISNQETVVSYSKGFDINYYEGYKTITVNNPWPGADELYTYALIEKGTEIPLNKNFDAVIEIPISSIVVTSTTHIPSLEMLDVQQSLVGFPGLNYISSEGTRNLISKGMIQELGKNEEINTELLLELSPDVVITFAVDGSSKTLTTLQKTGIPVVYNADWTETSPLGKAEWIKFFAAFFNKESAANQIFNTIEKEYLEAKTIASKANDSPTVLSGAMYRDVWYMPQGNSWAAQFIADANGEYLWKDSKGTGSLALNLETVLEKGKQADFWIGPGQFTSLKHLKDMNTVYPEFDAYKRSKIFSFTTVKGETGGVLYYELAPNRPDIVLKDIIKILHPELVSEHTLFFFSQLK